MKIIYATLTATVAILALSPVILVIYKLLQDALSDYVCSHGTRIRGIMLQCDCSEIPHLDDNMSCSTCQIIASHGECGFDSTNTAMSAANCYEKWSGPLCNDCNAVIETKHSCTGDCKHGYFGPRCSVECGRNTTCSGHGTCTKLGECVCDEGYWTAVFSKKCNTECPLGTDDKPCSGHGSCKQGLCQCHNNYLRYDCSKECNCGDGEHCNPDTFECVCEIGFERDENNVCKKEEILDGGTTDKKFLVRCSGATSPCRSRGKCSADGTRCECDRKYQQRNNRIIPVHEAVVQESVRELDCNDANVTSVLQTQTMTHAVEYVNSAGEGMFVSDTLGRLHGHELIRTAVKGVTLFALSDVETLNNKNDAFIVCANNPDVCQGVYQDSTDNSFRLVETHCNTENTCFRDINTAKDTVFLRNSLYKHECAKARLYVLDPAFVPCTTCIEGWGPVPTLNQENDNTCANYCSNANNTCNGHGACNSDTFLCDCFTTPALHTNLQNWDASANCATCQDNYFDETNYNCTIRCDDTGCNQARSRGACNISAEALEWTIRQWENGSTAQRPCSCIDPFINTTNCFRSCDPSQENQCSGHGECSGARCVCNTGFHGPACNFTCPDFFYRSAGNTLRSTCNGGDCMALKTYVGANQRTVFTRSKCNEDMDCGCNSVAQCKEHQIFCDTQEKTCSRVGCKCPDTYAGDRCHVAGCPLHTWEVDGVQVQSPCGEFPPDTNQHCSRGQCVSVNQTHMKGLTADNPAPSSSFFNPGACLCRNAIDRELKALHYDKENYTEQVCMRDIRLRYIGADTGCGGECLCDDSLKGVCATTTQAGCTCRQNPEGQTLFTGHSCSSVCSGACLWNETTMTCENIHRTVAMAKLSNACPCHANNCTHSLSQKGCYDNVYPCSRSGNCASGVCKCHSLAAEATKAVKHKLSTVVPSMNLYMGFGEDCSFKCPHSNATKWFELVEYFEQNELLLTRGIFTTKNDTDLQASTIERFYEIYADTVCSGHGVCDGTVSFVRKHKGLQCACDINHGGHDCSQRCLMEPETETVFRSLGYDDNMQVAAIAENFGISVCGAHARCTTLLSGRVDCLPNGASESKFEFDEKTGHFYDKSDLTVAMGHVSSIMSAPDERIISAYKPFFLGEYAECKANHFTHRPLDLDEVPGEVKNLHDVVIWQFRRTCNGECKTNSQAPNEVSGVVDVAMRPAHCCKECFADDWANYPNYGGCKTCLHNGANPDTQCRTCLKENADTKLDGSCELTTEHCSKCKPGFSYPYSTFTGNDFPKCVPCIQGLYGRECSGHGTCISVVSGAKPNYEAGLCNCDSGWTGVSCAKPSSAQCQNGGKLENGFCQCPFSATQLNHGGHGCQTAHTKKNPAPADRPCLVIGENGEQLECAGRGQCVDGACRCNSADLDPLMRCTEFNDNVATRHERRMCLCDKAGTSCGTAVGEEITNPCSLI